MFESDQNRLGLALLAAAGPSATPASFGQRLFAGMGQHDKYLADKEEREQRRKQLEAQQAFQAMQMQAMVQAQAERKAQQEKAAQAELAAMALKEKQGAFLGGGMGMRPTVEQATAGGGGPSPANLEKLNQRQPFDFATAVQLFGVDTAQKLAAAQDWGRPKVTRSTKELGPDGREYEFQLDEFGRKAGPGGAQYRAPIAVNQGDRTTMADPFNLNPIKAFQTNMAPGERERIDISRMSAGAASRQAGAAEDANQIQRAQMAQLRDLQIAEAQAKQKAAGIQREGGIATMADSINVIDKALTHPGRTTATGVSGQIDPRNYVAGTDATNFKVLLDQIGGKAFLQAFESLKGGGQITEVEGKKATDAIARLNRAQSDAEFKRALEDFRGVLSGAYKRSTGEEYKGSSGLSPQEQAELDQLRARFGKGR